MGWNQESQFRFQYTADGRNEMAWQPTPVYKPDRLKSKSISPVKTWETLTFYACIFMTVLAYGCVSDSEFMHHLDGWPRSAFLTVMVVAVFVGTAALLQSKVVQAMIKLAIVCSVVMIFRHIF